MRRIGRLIAKYWWVLAIVGCASSVTVPSNVPGSIAAIGQSSQTAKTLSALKYLPVYTLKGSKSYIWVVCPQTQNGAVTDLTGCSQNVNTEGVGKTPNVFMVGGKVKYLQGTRKLSQYSGTDSSNLIDVWITVPDQYQNFGALNKTQRAWLLGLVPIAESHFSYNTDKTTTLQIIADHKQIQVPVRTGLSWPPGLT